MFYVAPFFVASRIQDTAPRRLYNAGSQFEESDLARLGDVECPLSLQIALKPFYRCFTSRAFVTDSAK